eukprot:06141.XXX_56584_56697_1 [CDS] Oithona nana genome sequencing.
MTSISQFIRAFSKCSSALYQLYSHLPALQSFQIQSKS